MALFFRAATPPSLYSRSTDLTGAPEPGVFSTAQINAAVCNYYWLLWVIKNELKTNYLIFPAYSSAAGMPKVR